MQAGWLRRQVTIESPSLVEDARHILERTWTAVLTVRARIEPLPLRDRQFSIQANAEASHRITVRYGTPVTLQDRLRAAGDQVYQVVSIRDLDERHEDIEILAMYVQAGATYTT